MPQKRSACAEMRDFAQRAKGAANSSVCAALHRDAGHATSCKFGGKRDAQNDFAGAGSPDSLTTQDRRGREGSAASGAPARRPRAIA